jgi:hypothetical protein
MLFSFLRRRTEHDLQAPGSNPVTVMKKFRGSYLFTIHFGSVAAPEVPDLPSGSNPFKHEMLPGETRVLRESQFVPRIAAQPVTIQEQSGSDFLPKPINNQFARRGVNSRSGHGFRLRLHCRRLIHAVQSRGVEHLIIES